MFKNPSNENMEFLEQKKPILDQVQWRLIIMQITWGAGKKQGHHLNLFYSGIFFEKGKPVMIFMVSPLSKFPISDMIIGALKNDVQFIVCLSKIAEIL